MNKTNELKKVDYVITFFLLYFSSGFTGISYSGTFVLSMIGVLVLLALMVHGINFRINGTLIAVFGALFILRLASGISNEDSAKSITITLIQLLLAMIFVAKYSLRDLSKLYSRVMYFLCIVSLILYLLYILVPEFVEMLPSVENSVGTKAYDVIIATIYKNGSGYIRNQSIFWEPGAFQTYIILAIIFSIWVEKDITIAKIIIYSMSIVLTFSTVGYITFAAIMLVYVFDKNNNVSIKESDKRLIIVFIFMIVIIVAFNLLKNNANMYYQVFGKLKSYSDDMLKFKNTSTSVRVDAILKGFDAIRLHPFIGMGDDLYKAYAVYHGYNMITCTWINWFAAYGIFYGLIMNYGLFSFFKLCDTKRAYQILIWLCFMLAITSEEYAANISIIVFIFGAYNEKLNSRRIENENSGD